MLFIVPQVGLLDFCQVLLNVWEWVWDVLLPPNSGVKEDIQYGLLLYEHLIAFIFYSFWYSCCLWKINSLRRRSPVVLDRSEVRNPNIHQRTISSLHHISQQSGHVEVFRHQEDVTEIGQCRCLHGQGNLRLRYLFQNKLENVFNILEGEGVP